MKAIQIQLDYSGFDESDNVREGESSINDVEIEDLDMPVAGVFRRLAQLTRGQSLADKLGLFEGDSIVLTVKEAIASNVIMTTKKKTPTGYGVVRVRITASSGVPRVLWSDVL